jgi:hypothetical protein
MREAIDITDVDVDVEAEGENHGFNGNSEKAACMLSKQQDGLIDCVRCIQDSLRNVLSLLQQEDHADDAVLLESLYRTVKQAGTDGIIAEDVNVRPLDPVRLYPDFFSRNYCWTAARLLTVSGLVLFLCSSGLGIAAPDLSPRPTSRTIPLKPSQDP